MKRISTWVSEDIYEEITDSGMMISTLLRTMILMWLGGQFPEIEKLYEEEKERVDAIHTEFLLKGRRKPNLGSLSAANTLAEGHTDCA